VSVLFLCTGNYFRSRFAAALFDHLAAGAGLGVRASSAGLAPECFRRNPGPISPHTIGGLRARGIPLPDPVPLPRDVTAADLATARLVVALKESEHRPLVAARFPEWETRIRYWDVEDVGPGRPSPEQILATIEALVRPLLDELAVGEDAQPGRVVLD
jgi:protein-tyrosine phosphatase